MTSSGISSAQLFIFSCLNSSCDKNESFKVRLMFLNDKDFNIAILLFSMQFRAPLSESL
jgi:hypothetical protein